MFVPPATCCNALAKIDQTFVLVTQPIRCRAHCRRSSGSWIRNRRAGVSRDTDYILAELAEPVDAKFLVIVEREFADHCAQCDLRRFHVHFIQNFLYLHHDFAIAEDDDRVRALVGNDLGVANGHGLWRGIDGLGLELFGNV